MVHVWGSVRESVLSFLQGSRDTQAVRLEQQSPLPTSPHHRISAVVLLKHKAIQTEGTIQLNIFVLLIKHA